jgi:DNA-binding transcriptional LysR family regulator
MTRLPDLDDLALLVLVAETGSIGRAAERLGLTQPSVSRRMSALERSLGVGLLSRSRRGTSLTPAGRVVVDWAASLLANAEQFGRSVAALREQRSVTVRASVSMTIAEYHAPGWVAGLDRQAPDVVVSLDVHNSTEVAELVESGAADLGFLESPTIRSSLEARRIGWDRIAVAVAPEHAWARRRRPVTAADLAESRLLVREQGSGTRETLESALVGAGHELTGGVVMGSNSALTSAALAGLGPVVLSELALAAELRSGRLVEVPVEGISLRRPLSAVWRRDEALTEGATTLLRVAAASLGKGRPTPAM